jgi:hypothetical protein
MTVFHIYCDESCHLEHDRHRVMVLGSVRCPRDKVRETAVALRGIKARHGLSSKLELKWTKVSPGRLAFYRDVLDYFLEAEHLGFRAVVVPDKGELRHEAFRQTHDDFYFKLGFQLIRHWLSRHDQFRIFLDIKDTRSWEKTRRLREILANSHYDFDRNIVRTIELVRSEQVELIQLVDLLCGCLSYANRGLQTSPAKVALVAHLRKRTGLSLTQSTLVSEPKVNVFVWRPTREER